MHPLPEGLPGLPVQVVQPHHLKQLRAVLVRVAVHPVRVRPVRLQLVLRFLSWCRHGVHGDPTNSFGASGSGGLSALRLRSARRFSLRFRSAPGRSSALVRVHDQVLRADPQRGHDRRPRASRVAAQVDLFLAVLRAGLHGRRQAGCPILVRRALRGVFAATVRTAH